MLEVNNLLFSACEVLNDSCYIFGGRGSPHDPSDTFIKIDFDGLTTKIIETKTSAAFPEPRLV